MAITGDEGRGSLRKAAGSWQTSFDPQISEWGNPPLHRWLSMESVVLALCARTKAPQVKPRECVVGELEGERCPRVVCEDKSRSLMRESCMQG